MVSNSLPSLRNGLRMSKISRSEFLEMVETNLHTALASSSFKQTEFSSPQERQVLIVPVSSLFSWSYKQLLEVPSLLLYF